MRKAEEVVGGVPPAGVSLPFPTPRKCHDGENQRTGLQLLQPDQRNGPGQKGAGKQGHSPLLVFMSQEKVLHLLPSEVQLVVVVAFDSLGLVHRVIQRQKELLEGLHYGWWHTQVNLCDAAQPGGEEGEPR